MNLWLVRTAKNVIAGPYPKEKLLQMIQEGQLGPQDEVCEANHYWIYLHERDEVARQLGIHMPRGPRGPEDETTETQTQTQTETELEQTDPQLELPDAAAASAAHEGTQMLRSEEPQSAMPSTEELLSQPPLSERPGGISALPSAEASQSIDLPPRVTARNGGKPMVLDDIERPSPWRILIWIFAAAGLLCLAIILHALRK